MSVHNTKIHVYNLIAIISNNIKQEKLKFWLLFSIKTNLIKSDSMSKILSKNEFIILIYQLKKQFQENLTQKN